MDIVSSLKSSWDPLLTPMQYRKYTAGGKLSKRNFDNLKTWSQLPVRPLR